ncbi:Nn.00g103760.m01.CDS01 [Neocucurbitaria sp. VM-36]
MKTRLGLHTQAGHSLPTAANPIIIFLVVLYHIRTLLLFTCDQILDTVIPGTTFGIIAALSGPVLGFPVQDMSVILRRTPIVAVWLWVVILQFCLQNQCSPSSVQEDSLNKPWRPIPSGRILRTQAEYLLTSTHIVATVVSYYLDVLPIHVVYIILITAYNNFGGSDRSGILRNFYCGAGFSCYFSGAMSIALGPNISMSSQAWKWTFLVTFGTLATTIQTQDFRDEAGDEARGRRTLVTELGRKFALLTVIVTVSFWSLYTTMVFFTGGWKIVAIPIVLGGILIAVALRAIGEKSYKLDRWMYKTWCLWMFGFCILPIMKRLCDIVG